MRELLWWEGILPVLDFESTGIDPKTARPVQCALMLTTPRAHVLHGSYQTVIDPGCDIPEEAAAIHGISTERAKAEGVPSICAIENLITKLQGVFFLDLPIVAYNGMYDWVLLHAEAERLGLDVNSIPQLPLIDPYILDRGLDKYRKGARKLVNLVAEYGVEMDTAGAHDARWDCIATAEVFRAQVRRFPDLQRADLNDLQGLQRAYNAEWIASLSRHRVSKGEQPIIEAPWPGWPPLPQLEVVRT